MIRVLVNGALGRMGSEVCKKVYSEADLELVGAVDIKEGIVQLGDGVKVTTDLVAAIEAAKPDVVVDFTRPDVVMGNLRKMLPLGVHAVVGTTGFSDADLKEVDELARKHNTSLLIAPNFALGAVVMMKLACEAAKYFPHVEIIEKHHDNKLDAPSGTALALADSVNEAMDGQFEYIYDRSQVRRERGRKELGISAVRGGSIVGDHEVIFAGQDEVITFKHTAYSRAVFAKGSVAAAKYLKGRGAGLYDMSDVLL